MAYLQLADNMEQCPKCWANFVRYCQHDVMNEDEYTWVPTEVFTEQLVPYNANVFFGTLENFVEFDSEKDKLHFVLRWS